MSDECKQQYKTQSTNPGHEVNPGSDRTELVSDHERFTTNPATSHTEPANNALSRDGIGNDERLSQLTIAQLQLIENHQHLVPFPLTRDQVEVMATLREQTPEMYDLLLKAIETNVETDSFERKNKYLIPARYARFGQIIGFFAVLAMLGIVVYAINKDAYWLAGLFGTIDVVAIAAVFGSNQKPQERQ